MALSILIHPPALIMAYQPVSFTLQGTATGLPLRIAGGVTQAEGDSIQADGDKKATFELSDFLQGLISLRGQSGNVPVIYSDVPKAVTFTFIEWAGDPPVNIFDVETTTYYLLDGYIPKSRRKAFYAAYQSMLAYLVSSKSCLTWWPSSVAKKVFADQQEFINYLQVSSETDIDITLKVTLLFTDGTTANQGTIFTVQDVGYMYLIYLPTGCTQLGLPIIVASAFPDKVLAGYSVAVFNGAVNVSRVYSYTLDDNYYIATRTLYIRNPFGLLEILTCKGLGQQDSSIKPELAETDGNTLPDKLTWKTTREDTVKVNTGYLAAELMPWLTDLLDTTEAYEMISGVLHPIVLKDVNIPVIHDGEYQFDAEIEYEYTYTEKTEQA